MMKTLTMKTLKILTVTVSLLCACSASRAQIVFDAYADVWASYSQTKPENTERRWSTQPWRTNTLSVNLLTVGAQYRDSTMRGRLALQEGTFTQVNYVNADAAWRMIGEASIGVALGNDIWVDAGIIPSHIGYESARPAANITLTRSLIADYTPYYEMGVKLGYTGESGLHVAVIVMQGWQQIVDVNDDPAIGTALSLPLTSDVTLMWNTYVGNEAPRGQTTAIRAHSNMTLAASLSKAARVALLFDATVQPTAASDNSTMLYGGIQVQQNLADNLTLGLRGEYAYDPDGVLFATGRAIGFKTASGSVNVDYRLSTAVGWRTEVRYLHSNDSVFPSRYGDRSSDVMLNTCLAVTL